MDTVSVIQQSVKRLAGASDAIGQSIKLQLNTSDIVEKALRVLTEGKAAIAASRLTLR